MHVYGTLRVVEDQQRLQRIIELITDYYESSQPQPWRAEFTSEYSQRMLKRIVVFEIEIQKIQGKWKLNQNHPAERRQRVVNVLKTMSGDNSREIAALMEPGLEPVDVAEG